MYVKSLFFFLVFLTFVATQNAAAQSMTNNWAQMVMNNAITFSTNDSALAMKDSAMKILYGNTDADEGSPYNIFKKSQQFMETRLPSKNDALNVNEIYTKAIKTAIVNGSQPQPCIGNNGHWQNIGPKSPPYLQNQGMVTAIWSDPTTTIIIIGTQNGGLWRTDDGGANWHNISDNATGIGTMGIRSMTVNPNVPNAQDIYFTTYVSGAGFFNGGMGYGFGVYHTTDGGNNWTQESGFPFFTTIQNISFNPDNFYASCIKFCPYLINNQSYVVMAVQSHLFAKLSSWGSWVDLTPNQTWPNDGISQMNLANWWMQSSNIHDIEFPDDPGYKGTVVVSNTGWVGWERTTICKQDFFTSGASAGQANGAPQTLFNFAYNGMLFQGQPQGWGTADGIILGYSIEYMGNGNFRSITDKVNKWDIIDWNINNVDASGLVNVINVIYSQTNWPVVYNNIFECDRNSPNVIYMGADDGNSSLSSWALTRNSSNQWSVHSIPKNNLNNHGDHRCCFIANSNYNVSNPGLNDVVLYGNDGGLTKVTMNNLSASNVTFANLNGNGLYISDLIDADAADEHAITAASWHDGWYAYNKQTDVWTGHIYGDGMNATIDKRFTSGTGYTMIYTHSLQNDYGFEKVNSPTIIGVNYAAIPNPPGNQAEWIYRPMQFLNGIMYCTSYRAWNSPFMGYPANSSSWGPQHSTATIAYNSELNLHLAKQFQVCKNNINVKYHLLRGSGAPWKLARYSTAGWQNITQAQVFPGLSTGEKFPYTDLVVDDRNHDRIFVSMGSVPWNFDWGDNRVFYSPNGGATFIDISTNLPPVPVNCMLYQQGSDDIIYAGTDVGVYWWKHDKTITSTYTGCWVKMDGGMPNCLVSRLRFDLCEGKLIAATYGRGIWETPIVTMDPATSNVQLAAVSDVINSNTTWSADYRPEGSVQITNNATLTIVGTPNYNDHTSTTTIYMPHYGAIYVEPNCHLIVNGAKITNGCNGWYGIEAYGTTGQNQVYNTTDDKYPNQGFVTITNGIIENAEEAFRNYGQDGITGGVIQSAGGSTANEGTYFINNRRSANFGSYTNHNSSNNIIKDVSGFYNTKFLLNADAKQPFWSHVSMWEVRGIVFGDCKFYNTHGTQLDRRMAIESGNSTYRVKGGLFKGFYRAIQSGDYFSNILFPISIENAEFDGNELGVDFHAVNLPSLTNNTFKIGAKQSPPGWYFFSEGSRLYYTTNFRYCQNNHQKLYTPPAGVGFPYTSGLEVFSSGSPNVHIKMNNYEGLYIGTDIDNSCGVTSPPSGINLAGNTNSGNTGFDFIFQDKPKIHPYQHNSGTLNSSIDATQNTFSNGPAPQYHWYFNAGGNAPIIYKYINSLSNQTPTLFNSGVLNAISTNITPVSGCFAIDPVIIEVPESDLNAVKLDFATHEGIYDNLNSMYIQLIDNGSTEDELENLNGFGATNYLTLRAHLLGISPYVSEEVLDSVAHLGILPNVYLFEILMANPDATRNDDFLKYLEFDMPDPFPHYMMAMIEDSWQGVTVRTALERNMIAEMDKLSEDKNQILLLLGNHPEWYSDQEMIYWLNKLPNLRNTYLLIEQFLSQRDYTTADSLLNSIPSTYELDEIDQVEYEKYGELYLFKKDLLQNNIAIENLDSARKIALENMGSSRTQSMARTMARVPLCYFYHICFDDEVKGPPTATGNKLSAQNLGQMEKTKAVTLFPNPGHEFIIISWKLQVGEEAKEISVTDAAGKPVQTIPLNGNIGQYTWDVKSLNSGNYFYSFRDKQGKTISGSVSVVH